MLKLGSIIAWTLIVFGAVRVALGFFFAFGVSAEDNAYVAGRYLAAASTGEAINKGMVWMVVGVVVGLLVIIAKKDTISKKT